MRIFVTKSVRSSRDTAGTEPGASEASTRDQAIATTMRNTIGQLQVMVRIPLGKTPFCERPTESLCRIPSVETFEIRISLPTPRAGGCGACHPPQIGRAHV